MAPKKKKLVNTAADLISDLPGEIIDNIVERLPLRDFARLSKVSHKWHRIWTSKPQIVFDAQFSQYVTKNNSWQCEKFSNIVSSILFHHDAPIVKFSLHVPKLIECPNIAQWLSFVLKSDMKDFSIAYHVEYGPFKLGPRLFSCVDLENLKLHRCEFSPPPTFTEFRKLVHLELDSVIMKIGTVGDLIGKCPLLETLSLINCKDMEVIKIDAPKLRKLVVSGIFRSLSVEKPQNLVSASISLDESVRIRPKVDLHNLFKAIAKSCKLEEMCLGGHFCKVLLKQRLLAMAYVGSKKRKKITTKLFGSIRSLILRSIPFDSRSGLTAALHAIRCCPNIEKLNISVQKGCNPNETERKYSKFKLNRLTQAKVSMSTSTTDFNLVKILLASSPVLEVLELSFPDEVQKPMRALARMLVHQFPRASSKVKVVMLLGSN